MTLTKSWLQKQITDLEATRDEIPFGLDEDGNNTLVALKMALAGMETEPVFKINRDSSLIKHVKKVVRETSAPQPLTTSERAELENYRNAQQVVRSITQHFDDLALETAREIMCDVNRRHEFLGGEVQLLSRIQCRVDDACRAAMLQAGNSQAVTDGWVACSERTPEQGEYVSAISRHGEYVSGQVIDDWLELHDGTSFSVEELYLWMPLPALPAAPQQETE